MERIAPYFSRALMLMVSLPAALISLLLRFAQAVLGTGSAIGRFPPRGPASASSPPTSDPLARSPSWPRRRRSPSRSRSSSTTAGSRSAPRSMRVSWAPSLRYPSPPSSPPGTPTCGCYCRWRSWLSSSSSRPARGSWRLGRLVGAARAARGRSSRWRSTSLRASTGAAPGSRYGDTRAELLEGFWAQLSASVVLLFSGPLLGAYVRRESPAGRTPEPRRGALRRPFRRRSRRRARPVVAARGEARS